MLNKLWRYWRAFYRPIQRLFQASPYLIAVRKEPELRAVCRAYTHWMPLNLYAEPLQWLRLLLGTRNRYLTPGQRPYDVYVPYLEAQPFHPGSEITQWLEAAFPRIHSEYLGVSEQQGPPPNQAHVAAGHWGTFDMIREGAETELAARCPMTIETVRVLPLVDMVTFSTLLAGTRLRPHYGPTNVKLRHQLCIVNDEGARIRVGEHWRHWRQGGCLVIDDSFVHEVRHNGEQRRVVLLVDCWHPQLSRAERNFINRLYQIWGSKANK